MKHIYKTIALIIGFFLPLSAMAATPIVFPVNGGTGSTTLSGIILGNGTSPVKTTIIGSGLSLVADTLSAVGSTFSYPFVTLTNYGTTTSATTTPIWAQMGLYASSTSYFVNLNAINGTTTYATSTNLYTSGQTILAALGGNVGIATTSPYAALSVVGSTGVVADHYSATSTTATSTFDGGAEIGVGPAGIDIYATPSPIISIASSSPYAPLSVNGKVAASIFSADSIIASSTFANGINLTNKGCFAVGGVCITTGVSSVSNANGTLTISPTTGAVIASLNLANGNVWTAASSTYTGGITIGISTTTDATTTISNIQNLTVTSSSTLQNFTFLNATGTSATTTNISIISGVANPVFSVTGSTGMITASSTQPATSTTITLDWSATAPQVEYQIGSAAVSITLINATTTQYWGSRKLVWVCNPLTTSGALTWAGVEWVGATIPTQTTTANACDVYSFDITRATSTSAYKVSGTQGANFQ